MNVLNKHADKTCPELEDLESLLKCALEGVEGKKPAFWSKRFVLRFVFKAIRFSFVSRELILWIRNENLVWSSTFHRERLKVCTSCCMTSEMLNIFNSSNHNTTSSHSALTC